MERRRGTCCGRLTPWAPPNSSVLRRLKEQECDKDRSRTAVESEFQASGPETAKLRDPYRDSRQRGILRSGSEYDRRRDRPVERYVFGTLGNEANVI